MQKQQNAWLAAWPHSDDYAVVRHWHNEDNAKLVDYMPENTLLVAPEAIIAQPLSDDSLRQYLMLDDIQRWGNPYLLGFQLPEKRLHKLQSMLRQQFEMYRDDVFDLCLTNELRSIAECQIDEQGGYNLEVLYPHKMQLVA